ncbi:hypothetical protein FH972_003668 [Carpinus fangiana]|uniref:Uncharacterized protein n=1 Tax=Carpinus fangiana TaxID=176857 RepID=A0A5N6QM81_9ROSI|nr:hypothetical protein FH972_003668 [Carpinus fangiana]
MRSVLVMTVFVTMLVLVVAQVDDSSSITPPAPSPPSTFSPQQVVGSCDSLCELRCFLQRGIPQLYQFCLQLCKLTCPISGGGPPIPTPPTPPPSSFAVHHYEEKVKGDYVQNCYNNCKKNY